MRTAAGTFHSEWNSHMMSMRFPTAVRILRNGSSPTCKSCAEMSRPPEAMANGSNGQIFIAVMPMSSSDCASSAGCRVKAT